MTPTQGEHAQTALAHELFAAAQLAPGEGIEDAVNRIAAALTAAPQGVAYAELPDERKAFEAWASRSVGRVWRDTAPGRTEDYQDASTNLCWRAWQARASNGQAPAGAYKDSTPGLHVGDSSFESWYSGYKLDPTSIKQIARDAYAAGMGDPLVMSASTAQAAPAAGAVAGPSETLAEWVLHATPAEFNARNWEAVHQGLLRARETLNATGVSHSWIGPYIDIARQESQRVLPAAPTPAAQADSVRAPAGGAVAGPTVTREFTNELGNAIRITVEGPNSMHENIVTPMEAEQFRSALNEHAMRAADTTWCAYMAGMICTYLKEDAEGDKATAIAGIIERRLMFLSRSTAPMDRDTLYLLRRLLSNQFTFTASEFRAELEKIVNEAHTQADSITKERLKELLGKPETVHLNMLHGHIAVITMEQCAHLHGEEMQRKWAAADSVLEDAARWRRLVNASEMAFPVAAIVDDPENDAMKVYGRKRMEALIDMMDEIPGTYMDAARKQGGKHD
ncbi:hypothetical protein [Acidovorax sp. Leaf73]|uniref:hypothetical protein n=1 Tax=Acidovorax sp. Leaf73 TaxID=2876566 RepID=UPI001E3EA9E0|nr:hypothetical protein [Acidovorax sp. Leaf73]